MSRETLAARLLAIRQMAEDCLAELAPQEEPEAQASAPCRHPPDKCRPVSVLGRERYCEACHEIVPAGGDG